ncbi:hypothetical protein [Autumnicola psychrophila]|uniref:Uncharacterized protein n=1 Tax=Autumnicola psychrophila TaxID=3075592 RepID=A0ABU3DXQ9_9FLAO|nr:hypothetical protein [Zunongwangia sp. F225]MDT0687837.1 hypothetical protein [Zunongwangia sp. F225]
MESRTEKIFKELQIYREYRNEYTREERKEIKKKLRQEIRNI